MSNPQQETSLPDKPVIDATDHAETDQAAKISPGDHSSGIKIASGIAIVALILTIITLGLTYKVWQDIGIEQTALDQRINAAEKSIVGFESMSASSQALAESARTTSQSLQARIDGMTSGMDNLDETLNSALRELQQENLSLKDSLEILSNALGRNKDDHLLVAEARHLINIANHQAQLNHNPASAAAALEAADQRLRDATDPALLETRQILTADIIALRNIGALDISGIALILSELEARVDGLPLRQEAAQTSANNNADADTPVTDVSSFFSKIWSDIKGLVTVRRNDGEQGAALLPPGQRFFLEQNLRLKLETARLALLQGDTQRFHNSLDTAQQWIETYFNTEAAPVANLLTRLASYQDLELKPNLPDLSRSLKALQDWSNAQTAGASSS